MPSTIRFDQHELLAIDRWILELRIEAGLRQLDRAEVFRELIRMAMTSDETLRHALLYRLQQ
ncbi:hypothetical protein [Streptomyces sp. H39-S7]|uniref:hypothetical protein n=1 Tax=Streptomyces sp. H39-S7 TaxID=3004357 RepID=UPI0022AEF91F|nr:hypothetical protein [Streptomyces sp. H39-S7]MCZ4126153.1 hypothetical protein [Streptomyces sp. H39-S7]